jgi:ABC-2 type transport system ATP-binding protein
MSRRGSLVVDRVGEDPSVAVVEVRDVRKSYDGRPVVDGVSFTVDEGEIFGILGPNGAGKTTLVECIEGLRRHDEGRIRVLGLDPHRDGNALRQVLGAQLQASALQARLRVGEALELYASFYDDPLEPDRLMEMLGLVEHRNASFGTLSGGQRQRLSIALALIGRPRIAVLDELTTGLDPRARRDTWSLIEGVRDSGVTVLLVTHFMDEAERLCDRVAIIDRGRVVGLDRPAGLVSAVAGAQLLRFMPSQPLDDRLLVGLDEVTAVRHEGGEVLVTGNGNVIQRVMVALHHEGIVPVGVRVEQHDLEDVFVSLTGRQLEDPAVVEVPS